MSKCLKDGVFVILPFATIIHLFAEMKQFLDTFDVEMFPASDQFCHLFENGEVTLLLGGPKRETVEERNDVITKGLEVVDLQKPDTI